MSLISLSDRLDSLNEAFGNRLNHQSSDDDLRQMIGVILPTVRSDSAQAKEFQIQIVHSPNVPFFGMTVYPDWEELQRLSKYLFTTPEIGKFENEWSKVLNWVIEIDDRCFNDYEISFAPEELTAILLFEVMNVIYETTLSFTLANSLLNNIVSRSKYFVKKQELLHKLYQIPIITACQSKLWLLRRDNASDVSGTPYQFQILNDYIENLQDAIAKIVRHYGNEMISTYDQRVNLIEKDIIWANSFVEDYIKRKAYLRDDLFLRASSSGSPYQKYVFMTMLRDMGAGLRERYSGTAIEAIMPEMLSSPDFIKEYSPIFLTINKSGGILEDQYRNCDGRTKRALEGLFKSGVPKLPSDRDVDMVFVDIDRMENQFDRKYVLDRIYRLMDQIVQVEDYYSNDPDTLSRIQYIIDRQKSNLNMARDRVLSKRNFDKNYKVFVKVPEGYEG